VLTWSNCWISAVPTFVSQSHRPQEPQYSASNPTRARTEQTFLGTKSGQVQPWDYSWSRKYFKLLQGWPLLRRCLSGDSDNIGWIHSLLSPLICPRCLFLSRNSKPINAPRVPLWPWRHWYCISFNARSTVPESFRIQDIHCAESKPWAGLLWANEPCLASILQLHMLEHVFCWRL